MSRGEGEGGGKGEGTGRVEGRDKDRVLVRKYFHPTGNV